MKRKSKLLILPIATAIFIYGCGVDETEISENLDISDDTTIAEETLNDSEDYVDITDSIEFSMTTLAGYNYEFCSGAGGWSTDFQIEKDGYFHGTYFDGDMGDLDEENYPNGTMYYCDFTGHFSELTKIDEYTYEMTLEDISYANEPGELEYIDGTRYIYSTAYGLDGTETFKVHLAGKPVSEINEEVYSWLSMWNDDEETLSGICLENVDQEEGIYTYVRDNYKDEAASLYDSTQTSYDYYLGQVEECESTADYVSNAAERYKIADKCLNNLWNLIKYNFSEDDFNEILDEQRTWNEQKESDAAVYDNQEEYGTWGQVDKYDSLAEATMDRCKALLDYITEY